MVLQQNVNSTTRIVLQTVGLQQMGREDFILFIKGRQLTHFSGFLRYDNIAVVLFFSEINLTRHLLNTD